MSDDEKHQQIIDGIKQLIQAVDTIGLVISGGIMEMRKDIWEIQKLSNPYGNPITSHAKDEIEGLEKGRDMLKESLDRLSTRKPEWVNLKEKK